MPDMPSAVERLDPIDLQMAEDMEKPGGYSTAASDVRLTRRQVDGREK